MDALVRGQGVGRAMVSLETGTQHEFAAARALYAGCGFTPCGPFSHYTDAGTSLLMTLAL